MTWLCRALPNSLSPEGNGPPPLQESSRFPETRLANQLLQGDLSQIRMNKYNPRIGSGIAEEKGPAA